MKSRFSIGVLGTLFFYSLPVDANEEHRRLETGTGNSSHREIATIPAAAFVIEGAIDPVARPGGDLQAVASVILGWTKDSEPETRNPGIPSIAFEIREGSAIGSWEVWIDGVNETTRQPNPKPKGWAWDGKNQQPHLFRQRDGSYPLRITGAPTETGETLLRFYFQYLDRPVAEHRVTHALAGSPLFAHVKVGGNDTQKHVSEFALGIRSIESAELDADPVPRDIVLEALDLDYPALGEVNRALESGKREEAGRLLLAHFRERQAPRGPSLDEYEHGGNNLEIADNSLAGRYGTLGWFSQFAPEWTDADGVTHPWVLPDGTINWARENGHLNRHFHWVAYALADHETGDPKYAKRLSYEVQDWVGREPFFWEKCPQIGGVNLMDGTVFTKGFMNTSNIGRRCELTWWFAWEAFRKNPDFSDEAHFAMLLGFLRQARLLMNPSAFAAHDDGGAHSSMALLQTGLMLPEFRESAIWREQAMRQWDEVMKVQFYPDGSHVSGSTGYNWASIRALENFIALMRRTGSEIPPRFTETLARALKHPIGISRPDGGQVDMNDGGWSLVDDHYTRIVEKIFPDRNDFRWMATRGREGTEPDYCSIQFPHAGHLVQRTGWGENHKYLFLDAGPLGASHGKNDKLNLYFAMGPHQLISSGGRGSYDANPFSAYTGSTYGYNTILVDDLPQQRVHLPHTHTGHVPEQRRWVTSERFDFMEGFYRSGWYGAKKHVQGIHTREVLMVKGTNPPETAYWIVFDTVEAADKESHEYKALFHSRRDLAEIDPETQAFTCVDRGAGYRILPSHTKGLDCRNARAQMQPYVQGWHVVGKNRAPMNTAECIWNARGPTTRAWILEATPLPATWQIERWDWEEVESTAFLTIHHKGGATDRVERTRVGASSHFQIQSLDPQGNESAQHEILPLSE